MDFSWILLSITITLVTYVLLQLFNNHRYWQKCGVPSLPPLPLVGNLAPVIRFKMSMGELYQYAYKKYPNDRFVGIYEIHRPVLVIRDPKIVDKILVKDFQYFIDHSMITDDHGLLAFGLFQLRGQKWRTVRQKISPAFTNGKLKTMFNGMLKCSDTILTSIEENQNKDYEIRDAIAKYIVDLTANNVFGIEIGNKQTKDEFVNKGTSIFNVSKLRFLHLVAITIFPNVASWLGLKLIEEDTTDFYKRLLMNTFKERIEKKYERNDFAQQLIKLKEKGFIDIQTKDKSDDYLQLDEGANNTTENIEFDDDLLVGQAFQFFSAGFDPILTSVLITMYEMSRYPDTQNKARQQILEVLERHKGFSFEALQEMKYLEQCIQETLRLYPAAQFLFRECTSNYKIPDSDVEIETGQKVIIPIKALHMDPKYYPNPEVFDPERLPPNSIKYNSTYLPFGDGPRICIGVRYAMIVMKLTLAKIIANYKFKLSPKTCVPFKVQKHAIILIIKDKLLFQFSTI